jgi:eIF3 subunit 6 N terminal domain
MLSRRQEVVANLRNLQQAVAPIISALSNPQVIRSFRQDRSFNAAFLQVRVVWGSAAGTAGPPQCVRQGPRWCSINAASG